MFMKRTVAILLPLLILSFFFQGCITSNIKLFTDGTDPLKEFVLRGTGSKKVLLVPVNGTISLEAGGNVLRSRPGMVQETVSQLSLAEQDDNVKAIVLMVNSPGGTVTASDMLYEEIRRFKERSGIKVVVCMLDVAASGGYYISLPADLICAHPTTLTGSVGVIFLRPEIDGLMKMIGVGVNTGKSGKYKDMGSPFRGATEEENRLFQDIISSMAAQFTEKVQLHRRLTPAQMEDAATARIFTADDALKTGLIDRICYVDDAIEEAMKLAGIPSSSRVIVYRRDRFHNDNRYIMDTTASSGKPLVDTGILGQAASLSAGLYFLWPAAIP